jgi:hypothetical protein
MRNLDVLETIVTFFCFLDEIEKRLEAAVSHFQSLLRYASLKQSIVFVFLADMIILLIIEELLLLEIVLPDIVKSHIVQVVAVLTHLPEHNILFFGEFSDYI